MDLSNPWLFYVWTALMAYGVALVITLFRLRWKDPSFIHLMAVMSLSLLIQTTLVARANGFLLDWPSLAGIALPLQILALLFSYSFLQIYTRHEFSWRDRKWVVAGLVGISWLWYAWVQYEIRQGSVRIEDPNELHWTLQNIVRTLILIAGGTFLAICFHREIKSLRERLKNQYSDFANLRLPVLRIILVCYILLTILRAADFVTGPKYPLWEAMPVLHLVAAFALAQFALLHSHAFSNNVLKPSKEKLRPEELKDIESKLTQAFTKNKLYLRPEIRLNEVAQILNVKPYKLSAALGMAMHTNFFEFVNQYRVQHAKDLLCSDASDRLNISGIAADSGFNSKSVFNDTFKRMTGMTPSAFRRENRPN